jgi:hypothetical protein
MRHSTLTPNWKVTSLVVLAAIPVLLSGCGAVSSDSAAKASSAPLGVSAPLGSSAPKSGAFQYPPVGSLVAGTTSSVSVDQFDQAAEANTVAWCPLTTTLGPCSGTQFDYPGLNNHEGGDQTTAVMADENVTVIGSTTGYNTYKPTVSVVTNVNGTSTTNYLGTFSSPIDGVTLPNASGIFLVAEQSGRVDVCTVTNCASPPTWEGLGNPGLNPYPYIAATPDLGWAWVGSSGGNLALCDTISATALTCYVVSEYNGGPISAVAIDATGNSWVAATTGIYKCFNTCVQITDVPISSRGLVVQNNTNSDGSQNVVFTTGASTIGIVRTSATGLVQPTGFDAGNGAGVEKIVSVVPSQGTGFVALAGPVLANNTEKNEFVITCDTVALNCGSAGDIGPFFDNGAGINQAYLLPITIVQPSATSTPPTKIRAPHPKKKHV